MCKVTRRRVRRWPQQNLRPEKCRRAREGRPISQNSNRSFFSRRVVANATETTFLTKLKDNRDLRDRFSAFGFVYELKLLFWRKIA